VKVIYCLHSLAEHCHTKKIAPFFRGSAEERSKERVKWTRRARDSLRKGFDGGKQSALLQKIKDEIIPDGSPASTPPSTEEPPSQDTGAGTGLGFRSPTPKPIRTTDTPQQLEYSPVEVREITPVAFVPPVELFNAVSEPEDIQLPDNTDDQGEVTENTSGSVGFETLKEPRTSSFNFGFFDQLSAIKSRVASTSKGVDSSFLKLMTFWGILCCCLGLLFFHQSATLRTT